MGTLTRGNGSTSTAATTLNETNFLPKGGGGGGAIFTEQIVFFNVGK